MAIYADDLSKHDIADVAAYLDQFGKAVPEEFKPLWPSVGVMDEAIRSFVSRRRHLAAVAAQDKRDAVYAATAKREMEEDKANPEAWDRQIAAAAERLGMDRKRKEIDTTPVMQACPHCNADLPVAPNIRFWTAAELRTYADTLDALHATAMENLENSKTQ